MAGAIVSDLHIPNFTSQGTPASNIKQAREQALDDASAPLASTFLSACHESFIAELSTLSSSDLEEVDIDLTDFSNPSVLLAFPSARYRHNPVISDPTLLLQVLRGLAFIDHVTETTSSSTTFSDILQCNAVNGTGILGLAPGILSPTTVGTSFDSSTIPFRAVEAYRFAVWIGIHTRVYRWRVLSAALLDYDRSLPWEVVFMGLARDSIDNAVKYFNTRFGHTAVSVTKVTDVSGRADMLAAFSNSVTTTALVHQMNIDTLHHAPVSAESVCDCILSNTITNVKFPTFSDVRVPVRSTLAGDARASQSSVEFVVDVIASQPTNWIRVVERIVSTVPEAVKLLKCGPGTGLTKGINYPFSQGTVSTLDLSKFDLYKNKGITKQELIAVAGMAVNVLGTVNNKKLISNCRHVAESLAYTTTARRYHRVSASVGSREESIEKLEKALISGVDAGPFTTTFIFSGQGNQHPGMGYSLYQTVPLFRRTIDECHSILTAAGFPGVLAIITTEARGLTELEEFEASQAAIFSFEYALAKLWLSWGITPNVASHSLGEYVALVTANVLTLECVLMIIANRVRHMVQKCIVEAPVSSLQHPTVDFRMLRAWSQYPTEGNGYVAIFETPIIQLASSILGHSVGGVPLCPASVYLEQVLAGLELARRHLSVSFSERHVILRGIEYTNPLVYDEEVPRTVITNISLQGGDCGSFFVASRVDASTKESVHVRGEYKTEAISRTSTKFRRILPVIDRRISAVVKSRNGKATQVFSTRTIYEVIFPRVVDYAKEYHTMRSLTLDPTGMEGYASVRLPASYDRSKFVVHPVFTDTLLHVPGFVANMQGSSNDAYICTEVGSVKVIPDQVDNNASYAVYCSTAWLADQGVMLADAYAVKLSEPPVLVARLKDMHFRKVRLNSLKKSLLCASGKTAISHFHHHRNTLARPTSQVDEYTPPNYSATTKIPPKVSPTTPSPPGTEPQSEVFSLRTLVAEESLPEVIDGDVDIREILATILDVSPTDIGEDVTLESLGLDSLTSIEALAALKNKCGIGLPGHFFNDHPTTRKIKSYFTSRLSAPKTLPHDTVTYQVIPTKSNIQEKSEFSISVSPVTIARLTKALKLDTIPLLLQKPTTASPRALPLFLIHDGSGLINYYNGITSLGRQVWGFNNPRFATSESWSGITEMASLYADHISKITTTGPIILGGWSFGGIAAYETSLQLSRKGIKTQGLLLLDSPNPINHIPLSDVLINSIINLNNNNNKRSANSDLSRLVKAQFNMNAKMLGEYHPQSTPGGSGMRVVLLRSEEGFNPIDVPNVPLWLSDRSDSKLAVGGWDKLVSGPIEVLDIPGNHFTPFYPANIKRVAERMIEACAILEAE